MRILRMKAACMGDEGATGTLAIAPMPVACYLSSVGRVSLADGVGVRYCRGQQAERREDKKHRSTRA